MITMEKQEAGSTTALTGRLQAHAEINHSFGMEGLSLSMSMSVIA